MARKKRSFKNNHYKRFSRQRSTQNIRKNVLTLRNKPKINNIVKKTEYPVYKPVRRKKSVWKNIVDISKVPRETLDKPKKIVNDYITSIKNDAINELRVTVCGKRSERRRVLFQQGRAGRGVAGPIKKLKNAFSYVRC
nr:MAG: hypothetical protein [Microvirus sp.]